MCGIFGVIANNDNVKDQIFDGLRKLEYRGSVSYTHLTLPTKA